ncbi:MAG: S-adenosylmethionine:tRNA ribosyltransferase-isomerase [Anaerolineales bacterium]|uniref:S-adenosylmethionine:tRNA ribosyltransferase-isomerase n=1 Tax=Promineifilum sp. TaxID=2664178 RepID=UPI001DA92397|nr:S-adenosylmethionine:tRNA ribosyltransferase-isomerase [Anaerolineales bacterium]MCB8936730.1 S-adenosylmethionine:tRNA ribosyltransferase-isomerase [Promineifilum sp.]MCO5181328.1 S-adenosylmethionine:tRNA ribosyltransferase-isomerase [Promineifilum sp.]
MKRETLLFDRPTALVATRPAEADGRPRDAGRLLVSRASGHSHAGFRELADHLEPGDLLVVNRSATLPASLPATRKGGAPFILNLSTHYGGGLWLAEPRFSPAAPGPLPNLTPGSEIRVAGEEARLVAPYPGLARLWFVKFGGDTFALMARAGRPIRYGYVDREYDLDVYQTLFAAYPGSVEMPSAAYPFTRRVMDDLARRGVEIASIVLHTGVSSLEVETDVVEQHALYPEPYSVPRATAEMVNGTRQSGRRVVALGTTVVRALESAWDGRQVQPSTGFSRLYVHPGRPPQVVGGLLTGLHDPSTSHLAMLYALAGPDLIRGAYDEAVRERYLWHEFGDSHLILPQT